MLVQSYDNSNNNVNLLGQYFHPRPLDFDLPLFRAANQNTQASNNNNVLKMNITIIFISLKVLILVGLLPHKVLKDKSWKKSKTTNVFFEGSIFKDFPKKSAQMLQFYTLRKEKMTVQYHK